VQVPTWLMEILLDQVPPDDRSPERPLSRGFIASSTRAKQRKG
jgi:hypothetical protein